MQPALRPRPIPYRFENLPSLTRSEVALWNWYSRFGPDAGEWKSWVVDIFGHLLERPAGQQLQLVQTHLVDTQFSEKSLSFGSKQELLIGHNAENDVVLSAKAIADRHARVFLKEGQAYIEDLGSKLGTYLWDKRIQPKEVQAVKNGDQFTVFPYRFRVLLEQSWTAETDVALTECRVRPLSCSEFFQTSPTGWRIFAVNAHPGTKQVLLETSPSFLAKLHERILGPLGIQSAKHTLPSDDALLGFLVLAVIEHLNRRLKFPVQFSLVRCTRNAQADYARGMSLNFAIGVSGLTGHVRIFLPFEFLSECKPPASGESAANYPVGLCWRLPVSVGFVDFSPDEIAQIGLGDVVVVQHAAAALFPNDFSRGWSMVGEGRNFTRFQVDKYFERSASVGTGDEATAAASKPDVQALPLRLHVVLGEKEFTLAEIQSLNPGTVVELEASSSDPVRLMVNGRILGEGELVDVEGNLAVRVLRWRST